MKFCVIGLGRFGRQVIRTLAENGADVIGIDSSEKNINAIRDYVAQAMCTEINDLASLEAVGIEEMHVVILGIGEDFAKSILIAAMIKKHYPNCKLIARATGQIQQEIFSLLGVDQVVRPEQEAAIELADALSSPFTNLLRMNKEFSIGLIAAPDAFIGKSLEEINLYDDFKVNCVAISRHDEYISVNNNYVVLEDDKLVLSGKNENLKKILHL